MSAFTVFNATGPSGLRRLVASDYPRIPSTCLPQYDGWDGSIWLTHALTPPPTCTASEKPAPLSTASASAERTPGLAVQDDLLVVAQLLEGVAVEELALGDEHRARDLVDLVLVLLPHVDEDEVAAALLALLEHRLERVTEMVEPAAASAASSETAPQNVS